MDREDGGKERQVIRGLPNDGLTPARGAFPADSPFPRSRQRRRPAPARRSYGRAFRTTSVFFFGLIVLLGVIGAAEGLWGKNLHVAGTVETGDLNADWTTIFTADVCHDYEEQTGGSLSLQTFGGGTSGGTDCGCPDSQTYGLSGGSYDGGGTSGGGDCLPPCPDDSGFTVQGAQTFGGSYGGGGGGGSGGGDECVVVPECDAQIESGPPYGAQIATVTIQHAGKGYWCKIRAVVGNTGSIPFNLIGAATILDNGNQYGLEFYDLTDGYGKCEIAPYDGGSGQLSILSGGYHPPPPPPPDGGNLQVDPGGQASVECKVKVKDTAQKGWTYYFAIEVCVAQWNEDPSTGGSSDDFDACKHSSQHEGPDTPALPQPHETEAS